eukprot:scaffold9357_cov111-Cylindrotheca_fusiformis.AAC.2
MGASPTCVPGEPRASAWQKSGSLLDPHVDTTDTPSTSAHVKVLLRLRIQEMYARGDALTDFERKKLFGTTTMEQRSMALPTDRQKECAVYAHCARVTATLRTDDVRTAYVTSGIHTTYAELRS